MVLLEQSYRRKVQEVITFKWKYELTKRIKPKKMTIENRQIQSI